MLQNLKVRIGLILALLALSAWWLVEEQVTLGLDLQGGSHLALEVDQGEAAMTTDEQRQDAVDRALQIIRLRVDELGVSEPVVQQTGENRIIVELAGIDQQRAKETVQKTAFLEFQIVRDINELQPTLPRIDRAVAAAFGDRLRDEPGAPASPVGDLFETADTATPESAAADTTGGDTAGAVAVADDGEGEAATSAASSSPFSRRVVGPGPYGQLLFDTADVALVTSFIELPEVQRLLPRGSELLWGHPTTEDEPGFRSLYLADRRPIMTGEFLEDAVAQRDPTFPTRPLVLFELNRRGGRTFERATTEHVGDLMAVVLDERVYTAPVINSPIADRGQIELGGATFQEAADLALVLRAGALPAPLRVVEERSVGASLGQDSVDKGVIAGLIGVVLVVLTMIGIYRLAGVLAVVALGIYAMLVLGGLAGLGAVLTFPGIAGLILSVGMAVDANVLIFERIREELDAGRPPRAAMNEGFAHALSAIVDSNITTLITAFILFYVGTGPVRGFAVTLTIGIIASMFTAIFVTRTLFELYLARRTPAQGVSI